MTIGDRVIIHATAVIGSDGFGYRFLEGRFHKIPHTGTVIIEDDVEIGAGTTIDRRRLKMSLVDGPYAETKEVVGGFILVEARDMEEAVSLFDDDPIAAHCRLEIRPLVEDHRHSETGEGRPEFRAS